MTDSLNNVLLYSSSGSAQVWAALLVFKVLFQKDILSMLSEEKYRQWLIAKQWWPKLLSDLTDQNNSKSSKILEESDLTIEILLAADVSLTEFTKVIKSIKNLNLVNLNGKALTDLSGHLSFSAKEGQLKLNKVADSVEELDRHFKTLRNPNSNKIGFFAIALNLLVLFFSFYKNWTYQWLLWSILLIGNAYLLFTLYIETNQLIQIRNSLLIKEDTKPVRKV